MSDLFRKLANIRSSSNSISRTIQNASQRIIGKLEESMQNCSISKHDIKTVYKIGTFEFKQKYVIKTVAKARAILQILLERIKFLTQENIETFQEEFNFIHIGLVQLRVNPLTRLSLNKPIYLTLGDARHLDFKILIFGIIESNMAHGSDYFNCYPKLCLDITDETFKIP